MNMEEKKDKFNTNKTIVLELNYQCNLRCVHCYIPSEEKAPRRFMEYEDAKLIIDQIKEKGFKRILITGGEPMLNPDFCKIYSYAWDNDFIITLLTNATLMTNEIKNMLVEKKPAMMRVSLFGGDHESYKKVTGQDHLDLVYNNMIYLKEHGVNVMAKAPLLRQIDLKSLRAAQKDLAQRGISTKIEVRILPRFDGDTETINYRYTAKEIMEMGIDNAERGVEKFEKIKADCSSKKVKDIDYCIHKCQPYVVSPDCNLQLCFFFREWSVSLKKIPLVDACELLIEMIANTFQDVETLECAECDKQYMCPYCPGWAKTEQGSVNKKVPFLCELIGDYERKYNDLLK